MSDQTILCFSGRKQSGKNTSANYLVGTTMKKLGIIQGEFVMNPGGKLWISDLFGDKSKGQGVFDLENPHPEMGKFLTEEVHPYIKIYSFADILKLDVCMGVLGLTHEQCFGTDEQKASPTHLHWEDMPGIIPLAPPSKALKSVVKGRLGKYYDVVDGGVYHLPGIMTAREVMQYVGTDIFRKMWGDVWAISTINRIIEEGSLRPIITDCRFPNEVVVVQEVGGKVIRFTKDPSKGAKTHASETALDKDKFNWENFDAVIDNENMSIDEQNAELITVFDIWDEHEQKVLAT